MRFLIELTLRIKTPPGVNLNVYARRNFRRFKQLINKKSNPRILIIGCGKKFGQGVQELGREILDQSVNLDILPTELSNVVGDGHYLPFKENSFDGVVAQAVLEHVRNPVRVVKEIRRVLRKHGYVLADVPFLQPYHPDPSDYQRYTLEGITELFSTFQEVEKGICSGPISSFLKLFTIVLPILISFNNEFLYKSFHLSLRWLLFPLKYLDLFFIKNKRAHVVASAIYYIGKKV